MQKPSCVVNDRQKYIGGSDIPAILNISRFKTRWQLLQEKAGLIPIVEIDNPYIDFGNEMEAKIRFYINKNQAIPFVEECTVFEEKKIRVNVDGINEEGILEIKTTSSGNIKPRLEDYKEYLAQELFYMYMKDKQKGTLAVYERDNLFNVVFDPKKLHVYNFEITDFTDFVNQILSAVDKFLFDLDRLIANPELKEEDFVDNDIVSIVNKLSVLELELKQFEILKEQHKTLKDSLYNAMIKNDIKTFESKNGMKITRVDGREEKIEKVDKFNEEKFKEENQALYKKYIERVDVKTRGSSGYVKITFPKEKK